MRRTICVLLLLALTTDIAEARRSRHERKSYRFYRDFYEKHKDEVERPQKRRARLHSFDDDHGPVPYWDCDMVGENGWGTRRIVRWVCVGKGTE